VSGSSSSGQDFTGQMSVLSNPSKDSMGTVAMLDEALPGLCFPVVGLKIQAGFRAISAAVGGTP
jgi:hypothetical protein